MHEIKKDRYLVDVESVNFNPHEKTPEEMLFTHIGMHYLMPRVYAGYICSTIVQL